MKSYHDIATDGGSDVIGQVTAHASSVAERLSLVSRVVAVMSGKGGVGKSTITANLATALARRGQSIGVLDADLNSSSIARIMGVMGAPLQQTADGVRPATTALGIKVMSVDLLVAAGASPVVWDAPTQRDAYTWRSMMEMAALREFLSDTVWGPLDYLLIDMPPGSDRMPNLHDVVPQLTGAVVVTIPSAVSRFVVEKSIRMASEVAGTNVIGIIENMAYAVCSKCGNHEELFPQGKDGGVRAFAERLGVPLLGRIPFDRRIAEFADNGEPLPGDHEEAAEHAFNLLADQLLNLPTKQ